jgi:hypothetical protein
MSDGNLVTEHLNVFNTIISQLSSMDIKITEEEKCIRLLCSLPDSWDNLVVQDGQRFDGLSENILDWNLIQVVMGCQLYWKQQHRCS